MKNYLHRPPEYCRFIRSRFLNIDAILDAELRLLEHVTGKSNVAFSVFAWLKRAHWTPGSDISSRTEGLDQWCPGHHVRVWPIKKSVFTVISDDYGSPCGAEYIDFCSGMKILHKKFPDLSFTFLIFILYS